ncbi:hypothetical protein [Caballeronia telluris]|nr:hypothetical protein [Caballeronia telluris]
MTLMPALTGGLLFCLSNAVPIKSKSKVCGDNLMCYGEPVELLKEVIDGRTLQIDEDSHTVLDDFDHFCAYSGCNPNEVSAQAYAWAKLAFVSARISKL